MYNSYPRINSEADIKHKIIVPILYKCGWDLNDEYRIVYEYKSPNSNFRTDVMLFHRNKPIFILELKNRNNFNKQAKEQLAGYIYKWRNIDVPYSLVTNGITWDFYKHVKDEYCCESFDSITVENNNNFEEYARLLYNKLSVKKIMGRFYKKDVERCSDVLSYIVREQTIINKLTTTTKNADIINKTLKEHGYNIENTTNIILEGLIGIDPNGVLSKIVKQNKRNRDLIYDLILNVVLYNWDADRCMYPIQKYISDFKYQRPSYKNEINKNVSVICVDDRTINMVNKTKQKNKRIEK